MKQKIIRVLSGLATILSIIIIVLIVKFVDQYTFKFQSPLVFQQAILLEGKNAPVSQVIAADPVTVTPEQMDSVETEICKTFGTACRQALEIQHLEDGNEQCDRYHVNDNKTFDTGLLMVNSVHIGQVIDGHKITLAELTTCSGNIQDAYLIYKYSGFGAWSTWALIPNNLK